MRKSERFNAKAQRGKDAKGLKNAPVLQEEQETLRSVMLVKMGHFERRIGGAGYKSVAYRILLFWCAARH